MKCIVNNKFNKKKRRGNPIVRHVKNFFTWKKKWQICQRRFFFFFYSRMIFHSPWIGRSGFLITRIWLFASYWKSNGVLSELSMTALAGLLAKPRITIFSTLVGVWKWVSLCKVVALNVLDANENFFLNDIPFK